MEYVDEDDYGIRYISYPVEWGAKEGLPLQERG
jgi:hypothetical protein